MRSWIVVVVFVVVAAVAVAIAHANGLVALGWAHVFRMPKPEAIGAAIGAAVAVNLALSWRKRRDRRGRH